MKIFHSVRARIILLSTILLLFFLIVYTLTVWTVANSYALMNTAQNNSFSLSLLLNEVSGNLDDVKALVTRMAIDNELKYHLSYFDSDLNSYYDSFKNMVQSNPAYNVIDRFIVSDSAYSNFLQAGGPNITAGLPLRKDYFITELGHIDEENAFSGVFFSDLAHRNYQVIATVRPIIDYNNALTIGHVYASVSIDALLKNIYTYQRMNEAKLYVRFSDMAYKVDNGSLIPTPGLTRDSSEIIFEGGSGSIYKEDDGLYLLFCTDESNSFSIYLYFDTPSLIGSESTMPLVMLAVLIGGAILIITLTLAIYLNRVLYAPVKRLAKRIEKIQESDFSTDETINTDDEFGLIGRGINSLSSEVTDLMEKRLEDERKKLELEYRMLSSQIDPHFLYNTFNAIKWMAKIQKADGISEMITSLSRLMKNISKRDANIVTLSEEMSFIDDYLVIMKYRYGNTISYYRSMDDECMDIALPRFCLQPLVENAIFHGIEPRGTGAVAIIARKFGENTVIMVADNGVGFDTQKKESKGEGMFKHIGLDNIRQRLEHTWGDSVSFSISSKIGCGTECVIRIRDKEAE